MNKIGNHYAIWR